VQQILLLVVAVAAGLLMLILLLLLLAEVGNPVVDNEKVFLMDNEKMDNVKCIYFSLSLPQKKFGLTRPLSADNVRELPAANEK